ncbi:hypothetical protein [Thermocoleostomius sinensis]|jgi:hypothetical protein|uniref:Transporter n=1 Tax=Thermocoleostomius sinensis A174 TaxID=2016057 RepID=A0A9E8ZFE4_9CYAN|nr:hypothetical protein [Thermocoleostomius sinensis]WAL62047.1 hypothetical protein OXH18_08705 [Thermocoleostomius sinensis A174]
MTIWIQHQIQTYGRRVASIGLAGMLCLGSAKSAWANAFTQPQGSTFTGFTVRTFEADDFEKIELEAYVEYGLEDDVTLILKIPYAWIEDEFNGDRVDNSGFTDAELGVRWRFNDLDSSIATSLQGTVLIPMGYDADAELPLGRGAVGVEVRIPVSQGYQLAGRNGYWSVEAAYRQYFDSGVSNEIRLLGEVSQDIIDRIAVAAQLEQSIALSENDQFRDDESGFTKLTGQVWFRATDRLTFVFGGYTNIAGSDGGGLEGRIWYQF